MNLTYLKITDDLIYITFVFFLLLSMIFDHRSRKIPNYLTLPNIVLILLLKLAINKIHINLIEKLIAFSLSLYTLYKLEIIGGGDFKVLIVASIVLNTNLFLFYFISTLIITSLLIEVNKSRIKKVKLKEKTNLNHPPLVTIFGMVFFAIQLATALSLFFIVK